MSMNSGRTRGRSLIGVTAALFLLGSGAGCASDREESPAVAADRAAATDIELPVDAYSHSVPETGRILRARRLLTDKCMRRFGFDPPADLATIELATRNRVDDFGFYGNKRRYGVTLMEVAEKYGYHPVSIVEGTAQLVLAKEKSVQARPSSELGRLALTGGSADGEGERPRVNGRVVPTHGCAGQADAEIAPAGQIGDAQLVSKIARDSYERSMSDPAVTKGFSAWSACMRARGYTYSSPRVAGTNFKTEIRAVSPREVAAAKADVACKEQTRLVEIWRGFENRHQRAQIDRHAKEFNKIEKDRRAQMKRVTEIIADES